MTYTFFNKSRYIFMYAENIHFEPMTVNNFNVTITQGIIPGMDHAFGLEKQEMANRFDNGDTCFVAQDNGKFLGILWGHVGDCYIRGVGKRLDLKQDEVYLYGVLTLPSDRGKNVFSCLKDSFFKYYSAKGLNRYCTLVAPKNDIMKTSLKKNGFIEKSTLFSIKLGKFALLIGKTRHSFKVTAVSKEPEDCFII